MLVTSQGEGKGAAGVLPSSLQICVRSQPHTPRAQQRHGLCCGSCLRAGARSQLCCQHDVAGCVQLWPAPGVGWPGELLTARVAAATAAHACMEATAAEWHCTRVPNHPMCAWHTSSAAPLPTPAATSEAASKASSRAATAAPLGCAALLVRLSALQLIDLQRLAGARCLFRGSSSWPAAARAA